MYELTHRCVDCSQNEVPALHAMTEQARSISFRTFAARCNWKPIAAMMGYTVGPGKGLRLAHDRCVKFFRSTWNGKPCYYMQHSAIEFVFMVTDRPLNPRTAWA